MNTRLRHQVRTYVRKVIGNLGTVASGTMGEQRGTPTPVELQWTALTLIILGKFVYLHPDYLHMVFPCFLAEPFCTS